MLVTILTILVVGLSVALVWVLLARRQLTAQARLSPTPQPASMSRAAPASSSSQPENFNQYFELVSQLSDTALYDVSVSSGEVWWNKAFYTLFGYDASQTAGTVEWWASRIHPEDAMRVNESADRSLTAGASWEVDYRFRKADDSYLSVHDHIVVVRNEQGEPLHLIGALREVPSDNPASKSAP